MVADTAVMLLNAENGVEIGSELIWNYVENSRKPILFAVNHLDHQKADFDETVRPGRSDLGKDHPDAISRQDGRRLQRDYRPAQDDDVPLSATGGKPESCPSPRRKWKANRLHNELVEPRNDERTTYFEKGDDEGQTNSARAQARHALHHDVKPGLRPLRQARHGQRPTPWASSTTAPSATELLPEKLRK